MPLRFHWSLSQAGGQLRGSMRREDMPGVPSFDAQLELCLCAERSGIESMLMAIGFTRPDPLLLSVALGRRTERVKFLIACRAGLLAPTAFVQQVNTASHLIGGRITINMVTGHTPDELRYYGPCLPHDERYEQQDEFLQVCRALWRRDGEVCFVGRHYQVEGAVVGTPFASPEGAPEIYLGGTSPQAAEIAARHASCLWQIAEAPDRLRPVADRLRAQGTELGLLVALIARSTRDEARAAATALVESFGPEARQVHERLSRTTDSVGFTRTYDLAGGADWATPVLWTGAVPYLGPPSVALVGSADDVAAALLEYQAAGVSQFLFLGWPDVAEMTFFGREVLPRVRRAEQKARREC
jgi:alkanesulfonate monooxygenase